MARQTKRPGGIPAFSLRDDGCYFVAPLLDPLDPLVVPPAPEDGDCEPLGDALGLLLEPPLPVLPLLPELLPPMLPAVS